MINIRQVLVVSDEGEVFDFSEVEGHMTTYRTFERNRADTWDTKNPIDTVQIRFTK